MKTTLHNKYNIYVHINKTIPQKNGVKDVDIPWLLILIEELFDIRIYKIIFNKNNIRKEVKLYVNQRKYKTIGDVIKPNFIKWTQSVLSLNTRLFTFM